MIGADLSRSGPALLLHQKGWCTLRFAAQLASSPASRWRAVSRRRMARPRRPSSRVRWTNRSSRFWRSRAPWSSSPRSASRHRKRSGWWAGWRRRPGCRSDRSTRPDPGVDVVNAGEGKAQGLRVTQAGTHVGSVAGQVSVATGLEKPGTLTLLYSSQVLGGLTVRSDQPFRRPARAGTGQGVVLHVASNALIFVWTKRGSSRVPSRRPSRETTRRLATW